MRYAARYRYGDETDRSAAAAADDAAAAAAAAARSLGLFTRPSIPAVPAAAYGSESVAFRPIPRIGFERASLLTTGAAYFIVKSGFFFFSFLRYLNSRTIKWKKGGKRRGRLLGPIGLRKQSGDFNLDVDGYTGPSSNVFSDSTRRLSFVPSPFFSSLLHDTKLSDAGAK